MIADVPPTGRKIRDIGELNMGEEKKTRQYRDLKLLERRWFPLWKLDGYILREFLIKYSVLMLVFVILFILSDVYNDISEFLENKVALRIIVWYFLCKLPEKIPFILPISMLLGCVWTMAAFGKNMEVTAMRASGVSLFRCGFPIFAVGLVVTAVNIYLNETLTPISAREAEGTYEKYAKGREVQQNHLAFQSSDQKRRWLFKVYVNGNVQHNVEVKTFWSESLIPQLIGEPGTKRFNDNVRIIFPDRADKLLQLPGSEAVNAELSKLLRNRKLDITVLEEKNPDGGTSRKGEVEYRPRTGEWIFRKGTFVSYDRNDATPFAESRGTIACHKPIAFDELRFSAEEIPESPVDIVNSVKEKDDLPTWEIWRLLQRNKDMHDRVRAIYQTNFYFRLAFPWACFLAVFLGIPLATKNERTGSMLAIISAIGVVVVYIVVAQAFRVMGKGGYINPAVAGLLPTAGFIAYGMWRTLCDRN